MRLHLDRRIKLSHLRTIDALLNYGSLLKAAGPLGVSQPALTRTLHEIEEIVGRPLFDRLPRGMRPTDAGRVIAATAARMMADLQRLEEELAQLASGAETTVSIGCLPVAATGVLPGALQRLQQTAPHVKVRLQQARTEEMLSLLSSGAVDLVVGRLYSPCLPDGHLREPLWEEPIVVLARSSHPILDGRQISSEELRRHQLLLPTVGQRLGQEIEHAVDLLGLQSESALRSNSASFIREMLHGSDLLAMMPRLMMAGDLLRGTLRMVPLPVVTPSRPAGLILPRSRPPSPAATAFIAALRDYLGSVADARLGNVVSPERRFDRGGDGAGLRRGVAPPDLLH